MKNQFLDFTDKLNVIPKMRRGHQVTYPYAPLLFCVPTWNVMFYCII